MRTIDPLLHETVVRSASDLHVTAESPPILRIHGELVALEHPPLARAEARALCYGVLTEAQRRRFESERELDLAIAVPGLGRFRGNLYLTRGSVAGAFRAIPATPPALELLGLPAVVTSLACLPRGLVLVSGATGSGKSTTLAALIDHVNRQRHGHIVSLEDPIEFLHEPQCCLVTQREVSSDTAGFAQALRQVLRQDPDVVLVGEMRDRRPSRPRSPSQRPATSSSRRCTPAPRSRPSRGSSMPSRRISRRRCARSSHSCSRGSSRSSSSAAATARAGRSPPR
jgi:twitching motility protein PilT